MRHLIGKKFPVLNDGFVCLVDFMGSDEAIEQAARVSYGEGTRPVSDTRNLLRYLMRHKHTTPFEMAEIKLHVRVPIDCWRQWSRHRTASCSEISSRYSKVTDSCNTTLANQWRYQSKNNKQGSAGNIDESIGAFFTEKEEDAANKSRALYEALLASNVAREQARKVLPLSTYTEAYWKIDLHNLFHFLKLRMDSHAQLEIRQYAQTIARITRQLFPLSFEAFEDYSLYADPFTRIDKILLDLTVTHKISPSDPLLAELAATHGVSKRELSEFQDKLKIPTKLDLSLPE